MNAVGAKGSTSRFKMTDMKERYALWERDSDVSDPDSFDQDFHIFDSPRIGGRYKIHRTTSINLQSEFDTLANMGGERIRARIGTSLIDRLRQGEIAPVDVDATMINRANENSQSMPVAKRARRLLRFLVESSRSIEESIDLSWDSVMEMALGRSESSTEAQLDYLLGYLKEVGFIERTSARGYFRATIEGFETIEQEDASPEDSTSAFVALWFDEFTNGVRNAIEEAIRQSGYEPFLVNKQEFDGLIDDSIAAGIRAAKLVVADLTHGADGMRGSVYYEAGLARGQEKSVILTASKDQIDHKKIAFDLSHSPIIKWSEEVLPRFTQALRNRIEALFGTGPRAFTESIG